MKREAINKQFSLRNCYRVIEKITGEKLKGHELFNQQPKQGVK